MGNFRPLPMACFLLFLKENGFKLSRIKASHHIYTKPGSLRGIVVQGKNKDVPAMHLQTNCRTIGVSLAELYKWAETNC